MTDSERVQRAIDHAIERGEIGLQVAAYLDGKLVIDGWGGTADWETGRAVDGDTLFTVFSATKGVAATALHIQAERGLIDYDAKMTDYWPEFGANGKAGTTVRMALSHAIGTVGMPPGCTVAQMCDWQWMTEAIAAAAPTWEPGTKRGYHAYTFGWIIGELVRRTDPQGRPFGRWVAEELCLPLRIDSLWLGIPDEVEPRVARLKNTVPPADAPAPPPDALILQAIPPSLGVTQEIFGLPEVRRSCHPGAGGITNARSLARHYALLANGGELDGVRLLSPERVEQACALQSDEVDQVIGQSYRRGLGYWMGGSPDVNSVVMGSNPRAFGHPGAGGSIAWADPDARLAVAITKNRMLAPATAADNPLVELANEIRDILGVPGNVAAE